MSTDTAAAATLIPAPRRAARMVIFAMLVPLLMALLLPACTATGADEQTKSAGQQGYVGGAPGLTRVPPADRKPAPVASGPQLGDDRSISTGDYPGKVVVLNVWGSWCAPCRAEAKDLQAASVETAKIAQFIGINSKDPDPAPAAAFARTFGVTYPSIYDNNGTVLLRYSGALSLSIIPSTLIIDKQGRVAVRVTGPLTKITLVDLIEDVAAGK
jgi:thiol-disulfide isomerase/thioredoxin